jgi:GT2 family glycosyltransferase
MTCEVSDVSGTDHSDKAKSRLVTAIVLNYRNYPETINCLRGLLLQDYPALNCVVVDNMSPNDSVEQIHLALCGDSRIAVVQASRNGGYASGNNFGARWAIARHQPHYLLILNPDIEMLDRHTVARLVEFADSCEEAGAVSPKVVLPNGFHQGPYGRPSLVRTCIHYVAPFVWLVARTRHQKEARQTVLPRRCFRTIGACMLLRADSFAAAGMFDEGTFLEAEEPILAERLAVDGKYFYHYPGVTVIHHHSRPGESMYTIAALQYYFKHYRGAGPLSLKILGWCATLYDKIYNPLKRYLPFVQR